MNWERRGEPEVSRGFEWEEMTLGLVGESTGRKEGCVSLLSTLPPGQASGGSVDAVAIAATTAAASDSPARPVLGL